jgi:SAM-dependent methyltransferase
LTGAALRDAGARGTIAGLDVSEASLEIARAKGLYDRLDAVDLNGHLPLEDASIDGVLCVGVLTYVDAEPLFREWIRVIRPGGVAVFTSRDDFFELRGIAEILDRLEREGGWARVHISPSMPYLPGNPEFAEQVRVIYAVYRVA